jgi:phage protein D
MNLKKLKVKILKKPNKVSEKHGKTVSDIFQEIHIAHTLSPDVRLKILNDAIERVAQWSALNIDTSTSREGELVNSGQTQRQ